MKQVIYIFLSIFLFSGCIDDFLDKKPHDAAEKSLVFSSIEGVESALLGCYSALQSHYYYGRNFFIIQETYADNAKPSLRNTGQFTSFYSLQLTTGNYELEQLWLTAYQIIENCNAILSAVTKVPTPNPLVAKHIAGEAFALRALVYFDLVRLFSHSYAIPASSGFEGANGKGGHAGVPLLLSAQNTDSLHLPHRASVAEVYSQIISDLDTAKTLLETREISSYRLSKHAVHALLSMVHLTQRNYITALQYAEAVIYSGAYSLLSAQEYIESWSKEYTNESIFSLAMTPTDYPGTNSLSHMLSPRGYGGIIPSEDLLQRFSAIDIRNDFLQKQQETYIIKYPGRNGTLGLDNIPIIRLSELFLIQAECYAERAKTTPGFNHPAQQSVLFIINRANSNIHSVPETGTALLQKIYDEYRKELAFEGKRLFQLKRLHASFERTDCSSSICGLQYPHPKFTFPIPLAEILVNNNLTQNESY